MKKLISLLLACVLLLTLSTVTFAESVLGGNEEETITGDQYDDAQKDDKENEKEEDKKEESLPQTGIEDSGTGILLIVCAASAIFAYRKVKEYKNI